MYTCEIGYDARTSRPAFYISAPQLNEQLVGMTPNGIQVIILATTITYVSVANIPRYVMIAEVWQKLLDVLQPARTKVLRSHSTRQQYVPASPAVPSQLQFGLQFFGMGMVSLCLMCL